MKWMLMAMIGLFLMVLAAPAFAQGGHPPRRPPPPPWAEK
jgi:hypothetical protein